MSDVSTPWGKQREKMRQKLEDPEWRAAQRQKQQAANERARDKRRAQLASPEYQQKLKEKAREQTAKRIAKAREQASKPPARKTPSPRTSTRGLKGRPPTADERRFLALVGAMPCIACKLHGKHSPEASPHHIYGRSIADAHKCVIPLCKWHHQCAAPIAIRLQFPWLVPVHADGKIGGKSAFMEHNADEATLLQMVIDEIIISNILY
ncbi:Ref family recombination enhancement nuclease (plasmid) [Raoultella ornithinolytica]|uniref:Ref family recombination enhancement nuclease n=1 Tax=Raoultella ornithinolytica TaxID=54291 RepID=UPI003F6593DC